jgi:membrane associated rhomboid family serine protease
MSYRGYRSDNIAPVLAIIILCFLVYIATSIVNFTWNPGEQTSLFDFCQTASQIFKLYANQIDPLTFLLGLTPACFKCMPWTIITDLFVHGSIWHILFNMITLYFFGTFLLRLVGTRDFLIIYFLGGIVGNIFFMLFAFMGFLTSQFAIVIGASGAIFALGGTLAVLTPKLRVFVFPIPVPMPLWVAVIGGFVIVSFVGGVAWQGHLGGLVTGLLAGFVLRNRVRTPIS